MKRPAKLRSRFRWQYCTECGHGGLGLAVLHLQDCFTCSVCKYSTVRRYGSPNAELSDRCAHTTETPILLNNTYEKTYQATQH